VKVPEKLTHRYGRIETSAKAKEVVMSLVHVDKTTLSVTSGLVRIGAVHDEEWLEPGSLDDPEILIQKIAATKVPLDIFSFSQRLPETTPKYNYHMEWDNLAVVPITTFDGWWAGLPQATRKNVRRSAKRGVEVRVAEFDDEFVKGIMGIYNETPIRQGRRFWHYGKDFVTVKGENSTYLANCDFIGAYHGKELIGFMKVVYAGKEARMMQIISMVKHQDARPTNALIAKAMEICEKRQMKYFIYGKYIYGGRTNSPIIEFKNRNGFQMMEIPRYYVPLTAKGRIALELRLHRGILALIPAKVSNRLIDIRAKWYERNAKGKRQEEESVAE
jgi:hypothetical protein